MMLPQEIIRLKRAGQTLSQEQIAEFIAGVTDGTIVDAQIAAFTMAAFLNGLNLEETTALTENMRDSGDVLSWKNLNGPVVDKHSSGGVGDKVSLMLAPMIAACGGYVPMISGRGLGHTGGTLDKFDSIPGYQTCPDNTLFKKVVKQVGCAIIGQTGNLAPADKRIYAVRDVCGTVESVELITASILSKKLAAGFSRATPCSRSSQRMTAREVTNKFTAIKTDNTAQAMFQPFPVLFAKNRFSHGNNSRTKASPNNPQSTAICKQTRP